MTITGWLHLCTQVPSPPTSSGQTSPASPVPPCPLGLSHQNVNMLHIPHTQKRPTLDPTALSRGHPTSRPLWSMSSQESPKSTVSHPPPRTLSEAALPRGPDALHCHTQGHLSTPISLAPEQLAIPSQVQTPFLTQEMRPHGPPPDPTQPPLLSPVFPRGSQRAQGSVFAPIFCLDGAPGTSTLRCDPQCRLLCQLPHLLLWPGLAPPSNPTLTPNSLPNSTPPTHSTDPRVLAPSLLALYSSPLSPSVATFPYPVSLYYTLKPLCHPTLSALHKTDLGLNQASPPRAPPSQPDSLTCVTALTSPAPPPTLTHLAGAALSSCEHQHAHLRPGLVPAPH